MLAAVAIIVAAAIAGVLVFAATKPDTFRVERATDIGAKPENIFPFINDLKRWEAWSPWEKKDPAMKKTFGAATAGPGASYAWEGNKDVGKGRMEVTESVPSSRVTFVLDFEMPFEAHNTVEFTLKPGGNKTTVTWAMHGPSGYISKLMQVFMNMDRMVGKDFETGLANLKAAAEGT